MTSLNLTRWIFLSRVMEHLCSLSIAEIELNRVIITAALLREINHVYALQANGAWDMTKCDKAYIDYLEHITSAVDDLQMEEIRRIGQEIRENRVEKIKVLFLASDISVWPSIETVYHAMKEDPRFIVDMIDLPISYSRQYVDANFYREHKQSGHDIKPYYEYNVSQESPDVAIYSKPYGGDRVVPPQLYISDLRKAVPRSVLVPYAFFDLSDNDFYIFNGYRFPLHYFAWKWIGYSEKFKEQAERISFNAGKNVLVSGHPKFDQISRLGDYQCAVKDEYEEIIAGRTVVLYNSHHKLGLQPTDSGAFTEYYDVLFRYFEEHKDMVLIWRPHPFFFVTALEVFRQKELDAIRKRIKQCDNIILDESENYLASFALSSAILTDGATSMAFEYTATGRPVYYTAKTQGGFVMPNGSVADIWYWIRNERDLINSLDQIRLSQDPMKKTRMEGLNKYIGSIDGCCGNRIKDSVYEDLIAEEAKRADGFLTSLTMNYSLI